MSNTAINELKRRFKRVYILLDNDKPGLLDGVQLAKSTGFINIILPQFEGAKDVSDMYKALNNKELFKQTILKLFK
jgi:DNA primase